jgi:4-alpha-glucanotransferase
LRSRRTWGCGDFSSLASLVAWAAQRGASVLGTLPLLSAPIGRTIEASPYAPDSRCAWNEVYVDAEREPEFRRLERRMRIAARARGRALDAAERIPWEEVFALKREVLAAMYERFRRSEGSRRRPLERFLAERPMVRAYAAFRERAESRARVCRSGPVRPMPEGYHAFAQWLADRQLRRVRRRADRLGVRLYFDLPLGVHPDGFDARRTPAVWLRGASVGAPPDAFHPGGQSWGLPPPHPGGLRATGYAPVREALRHHFGAAPLLRVDHAMGLHRLFWVPPGLSAADGVYVRYPADEQYAVYGLEADLGGGSYVGEDLGTVSSEVRPAMRRNGWLGSYVYQLEWEVAAERPLRRAPARCLASLNTHDLPPFAAFWERQRDPRTRSRATPRRVRDADTPGEALRRAFSILARGPARIALVNLEDLWDETRPQNVPGTGSELANFSRRCARGLEEIARDPDIAERLTHVARWRPKVSSG